VVINTDALAVAESAAFASLPKASSAAMHDSARMFFFMCIFLCWLFNIELLTLTGILSPLVGHQKAKIRAKP
jgi:hypothetical protein